jgi:hypothetical protein
MVNTGGLTDFMEKIEDHYACSRPSHKYAQKNLQFSKSRIPRMLPENMFPL